MNASYDLEQLVSSLEMLDDSTWQGEFAYVTEDGKIRSEDPR